MRQDNHFPSFFVGKKKKIKKRRASIVVKTSASNDRPLLALASDKVEREDGLSELYLPPQVPVASLPSPAVVDLEAMLGPWTQARFLALTAANGSLPPGP